MAICLLIDRLPSVLVVMCLCCSRVADRGSEAHALSMHGFSLEQGYLQRQAASRQKFAELCRGSACPIHPVVCECACRLSQSTAAMCSFLAAWTSQRWTAPSHTSLRRKRSRWVGALLCEHCAAVSQGAAGVQRASVSSLTLVRSAVSLSSHVYNSAI